MATTADCCVERCRRGRDAAEEISEAGTERMFSSEKQIHSALRQAMSPDFTLAVMRMRWNFEPLMQFLNIRDEHNNVDNEVEIVPFA